MGFIPSMIKLATCLSVFLCASQASAETKVTLANLCANKALSLTSLSQTRQLIEQVTTIDPKSCSKYKSALIDLDPILEIVQSGKTPNLEFVRSVTKYHENYIHEEKNQIRDGIPQALRQFFISLCFQISAEFKMNLINNLEVDTEEFIDESDYKTINLLDEVGATFSDNDTPIDDFDDIVLMDDINRVTGLEKEGETKLMIKIKTSDMLRELINTCNNKFRPIYEKLILPLIGLSNMGYNYKGEILQRELEELRTNPLARRWYIIVQTCETFKTLEIFEASEPILETGRQAFIFISPEEAEEMRKQHLSLNSEPIEGGPISYEPQAAHNDELWIQNQQELQHLVNKYRASSSETDRVRKTLLRKMMKRIKESLKSGKILIYAGELIKNKLSDSPPVTNINEELIGMMDNAVEEREATTLVNKIDNPVAGLNPFNSKARQRNGYVPPRHSYIPQRVDGSKASVKIYDWTIGKILPKKWDIFFWFIGIFGVLLIAIGIVGFAVTG